MSRHRSSTTIATGIILLLGLRCGGAFRHHSGRRVDALAGCPAYQAAEAPERAQAIAVDAEDRVYVDDLVTRIEHRLEAGWDGRPIPGISLERLAEINGRPAVITPPIED